MKFKKFLSVTLLLIFAISLFACGNENSSTSDASSGKENSSEAEITVTDMMGREINIIPCGYKRVVCIGAGALRMYSYVCNVELLCAVEDIDNLTLSARPTMFDSVARPYVIAFRDVFGSLPSCGVGGPMAQAAEAEKILSCNPDIVISEYEDADKANALQEQLGIPVVTLKSGANGVFDECFKETLKLLGVIFGETERAETLISFIEKQTEEITNRTKDIPEEDKPQVYICGLGNWGTTNYLTTSQNYVPFQIAGIKNVVTGLSSDGVCEIEEEKFVDIGSDIDIMIIDAAAIKNIVPSYMIDFTIFSTCKAWKTGEVYLQMAYNAYYTNHEISLINTWFVAKTVYPHLFEDIDIEEKTNEICKAFLGKEMADEIFQYPSSFGGYQKIDIKTFFVGNNTVPVRPNCY